MAAYGLYTHIQSNKRRSIALLIGLFFLVYVMVYAGALLAAALSYDASLQWLLQRAWRDFLYAAPWATLGTALWIMIAYKFHQAMIDAVTGGHEVTHIRNGDVRMLVIAVIIAGVVSFFAELLFRLFFNSGGGWGRRSGGSDSDRGKGGAGFAIVIAIALVALAWFLSVVIRFA